METLDAAIPERVFACRPIPEAACLRERLWLARAECRRRDLLNVGRVGNSRGDLEVAGI